MEANSQGRFYVYHLIDPRDDAVFYVGKGQRSRGNDHLKAVAQHEPGSKHPKDQRIRQVVGSGENVKVEVVKRFSNEKDAYAFEKKEIKRLGLNNLTNLLNGFEPKSETDKPAEILNLTPKQEKFCLKYIELGCATKAYYAAYDAKGSKPITANRSAKTLLDNPKIAARVRELQSLHLQRHIVTVDSITSELEEARGVAMRTAQPSAAITASMGKAKIHGLMVDKHEHTGKDGNPIETKDKTAEDVAKRIAFLLTRATSKDGK